ncbi:MAG TPA: hypothetical protein VNO26_06050 [Candidatus Limnocylindria bacterium]|nr:hypothetical protein [Candidatus Limnocylindria bacterium]
MHYHLVTTDGDGRLPAVRTVGTPSEAEREALRLAMAWGDWAPKRYPGRSWKRGEVAVYLDRTSSAHQAPILREVSVVRCPASSDEAPDCLLRAMGIPALNLEPARPVESAPEPVVPRGQRAG